MKRSTLLMIIISLSLLGVGWLVTKSNNTTKNTSGTVKEVIDKAGSIFSSDFDFDKNTPGYENFTQLSRGCPFKDCIPSIDNPKFESVSEASKWLKDNDIVFVSKNKAYPQRILNWHEIVNDELLISFCPLCGSAIAFDRKVDGETLEFGVSGFLHNSDLIMYDRKTNSLWQQITGEAIVGENFGKVLTQIPLSGMRWSQFRQTLPKGLVLSRDTGANRDYDRYPYGDYEQNTQVNFPVQGGVDSTIHPKTVIYGISINKDNKAYKEKSLENEKTINDNVGGVDLVIKYNEGNPTVTRKNTNEQIPASRMFWFAWKAFRPNTKLY